MTGNGVWADGYYEFTGLQAGAYWVRESLADKTGWFQTTTDPGLITMTSGADWTPGTPTPEEPFKDTGLAFGNYLPHLNAHTLGFWSNKNGHDEIDQMIGEGIDVYAELRALNLRNENGTNFDPTNFTQLHNWLLAGSAKNMAYMLSVQFAAMKLNVLAGFVNTGDSILVNGAPTTIGSLMTDANNLLGTYGVVTSGKNPVNSSIRPQMALLEGALDAANNNQNWFVSSSTLSLLNINLSQLYYNPLNNYLWVA